MTRDELLSLLAVEIERAANRERVALAGIDGRSAAGKTTLADELEGALTSRGHTVHRASIDDFHPPGHAQRSASGGYTAESYYAEGFDYALFARELLQPARGMEPRGARLRAWDSYHDRPNEDESVRFTPGDVLVVDGAFILRPELRGFWDYVVWLDISFETMVERARRRDLAWMPSVEAIEERYRQRWVPLHTLYETRTGARDFASVIVDNTDPANPAIVPM